MLQAHFAVASAFSPRFGAVIAEADRVAQKFGARLSVLHAGERSNEKMEKFQETFAALGRSDVDVYWCEGASAAEALLDVAASEGFDLLVAGAPLVSPSQLRNFTDDVVRALLKHAPCDLLLIPNPQEKAPERLRVCLMVEAHHPRWQAARDALATLAPATISVLAADSPFTHALEATLGYEEDDSDITVLREALEQIASEVDLRVVESNTGFTLCDIVQEAAPDFLIVEMEWKGCQGSFPRHLDWLNQVIPARLFLLGHGQAKEEKMLAKNAS